MRGIAALNVSAPRASLVRAASTQAAVIPANLSLAEEKPMPHSLRPVNLANPWGRWQLAFSSAIERRWQLAFSSAIERRYSIRALL
ncbi:hypothetical protein GN244_ATG06244 [Phytophthora infestans]|uniref:Uncharacterized protein n=1 Tax=Phytophthora infestans TaxID=4787 RepID=A0A833SVR6_PHYIN|nr:hypothetical protein GN244_ATG06244 [Phytophthora infestans]KAF4143777.1 hypothetical protein GN958_ATG07029 [Phytophthora infestans]